MPAMRSVAIAGASGTLGRRVLSAFLLPEFRRSFSQIIVLKRATGSSSASIVSTNENFISRIYDSSNLAAALDGVDVLINVIGPSGHKFKDDLLRAIPNTNVKIYVPSEFGVDHDIHDFPHAEWDQKKHHVALAKNILTTTRMCRIFIGLFTEESIGPWFGFDTVGRKYEIVGSAAQPVTYTSLDDVGKVVVSVSRLPEEQVPERIHIAGDTLSSKMLAQTMELAGSDHIEIKELDLETSRAKTLAGDSSDPSQYLRFLMGEGKINHSSGGLGNDNELVNPGESVWKWKTMANYAKETRGKPWADFKWDPASIQ